MTAAQYTFPSPVGCSVMSVIHKRFGSSAVKSRLTKEASPRTAEVVLGLAGDVAVR
jgi:hypothetical protein